MLILKSNSKFSGSNSDLPHVDYYNDLNSQNSAIFSLERLKRDYLGPAVRVRRSNDNQEKNISFKEPGVLDIESLLSFVGGNTGNIVKWYDQTGSGREFAQTDASKQPIIVLSGELQTQNDKPALLFSTSGLHFLSSQGLKDALVNKMYIAVAAVFSSSRNSQNASEGRFLQITLSNNLNSSKFAIGYDSSRLFNVIYREGDSSTDVVKTIKKQSIFETNRAYHVFSDAFFKNNGFAKLKVDNNLIEEQQMATVGVVSLAPMNTPLLGSSSSTGDSLYKGKMSELIIHFDSDNNLELDKVVADQIFRYSL